MWILERLFGSGRPATEEIQHRLEQTKKALAKSGKPQAIASYYYNELRRFGDMPPDTAGVLPGSSVRGNPEGPAGLVVQWSGKQFVVREKHEFVQHSGDFAVTLSVECAGSTIIELNCEKIHARSGTRLAFQSVGGWLPGESTDKFTEFVRLGRKHAIDVHDKAMKRHSAVSAENDRKKFGI